MSLSKILVVILSSYMQTATKEELKDVKQLLNYNTFIRLFTPIQMDVLNQELIKRGL